MKRLSLIAILCGTVAAWGAAAGAERGILQLQSHPFVVSRSGQFNVRVLTPQQFSRSVDREEGITLEGTLVAVSCERVKTALLRELDLADRFAGKVHITISPAKSSSAVIPVISTRYNDGWQYAIELPGKLTQVLFVRAITQCLLLELANRGAGRSAEIPLWLSEGFAQKLMAEIGPGLLLKSETRASREGVRFEPGRYLRETQPGLQMLSFTEMSQTTPAFAARQDGNTFSATALLFVHELLSLEKGKAAMTQFIQSLPHRWNWQTALVETHGAHFRTLLDVEKWWSVTRVDLVTPDRMAADGTDASLARLEQTLQTTAYERTGTNGIPEQVVMSLQDLVRKTEFDQHREILAQKARQLAMLQSRMRPELALLSEGYLVALRNYLAAREARVVSAGLRLPKPVQNRAAADRLVEDLNELDTELEAVQKKLADAAQSPVDPRVLNPERQR